MFTEYRKIHIVVIAKLGINIYIHTVSYVENEGIYIVFALSGECTQFYEAFMYFLLGESRGVLR